MSDRVRPHNVTLTDELWDNLIARHDNVSAAIEDHCRAAEGLPPRPDVSTRGQWQPGECGLTRRKKRQRKAP